MSHDKRNSCRKALVSVQDCVFHGPPSEGRGLALLGSSPAYRRLPPKSEEHGTSNGPRVRTLMDYNDKHYSNNGNGHYQAAES